MEQIERVPGINKGLFICKLISFKAVGCRSSPAAILRRGRLLLKRVSNYRHSLLIHWYQRNHNRPNSSAVTISPAWVVCIGLQGCGCVVCGLLEYGLWTFDYLLLLIIC